MEYELAKAIPLNAREATRGAPSPRNVFVIIVKHARESARRLVVSVKEREDGEVAIVALPPMVAGVGKKSISAGLFVTVGGSPASCAVMS